MDGFITLSNSVNLADAPRLKDMSLRHSQCQELKLANALNGQLLLCKVFIGQSVEMKDNKVLVSATVFCHLGTFD